MVIVTVMPWNFVLMLGFILIIVGTAGVVDGIKCFAGQKDSNFRVSTPREYECNPKFDRCYIAFCDYDDPIYGGYYRMGCADANFCQNQTKAIWRSRCSELKGRGTFFDKDFKAASPCDLCKSNLCNSPDGL